MADGATPDDAFKEAVRRFGPLTESKARLLEAARHREQRMQRTEYLADLRQDLSFAARTLGRQKAWTAVTIATLALGVGATTAVFSVVSSLMLHMLPYPGGNRLAFVYQQPATGNNTGISVTITPNAPVVRAWKQGAHSFEALEGFKRAEMEMRTSGNPSTLNVGRVEPTFSTFADERPIAGRMFTAQDVAAGGRVAVLSEPLWRTRFGADQSVIGRAITLDDSLYTVIGVSSASLQWPAIGEAPRDVWLPLDLGKDKLSMMVIGRLRRGANAEAAARELDSLYARSSGLTGGRIEFRAVAMPPSRRLPYRDSLVMLTFAVGLVLLIACANVAHLLMARSASRHRELAIRAALGAGRGRVLRQLLTESLLLAVTGTAMGVLVGWAGLKTLVALRPPSLSTLAARASRRDDARDRGDRRDGHGHRVRTSWRGAVGAQSANESLKSWKLACRRRTTSTRTLLVVSEMALSATLVVGATMLVRSVINLQNADLGFEAKGLYSLNLSGATKRVWKRDGQGRSACARVTARLAAIPGVKSAALASTPPSWRSFSVGRLEIEGEAPSTARRRRSST